jgi:hypothetical protein
MEFGKRGNDFIKGDISRIIYCAYRYIKAFKAFVKRTITKKDTMLGLELKFMCAVWMKIEPTSTTENAKR